MTILGYAFLIISVVLNLLAIWYIRELLKIFTTSANDFILLKKNSDSFLSELEEIYNSERYFGEPKLELLLEQGKEFGQQIGEMVEIYSLKENEKND
jgi:hypothetical protein